MRYLFFFLLILTAFQVKSQSIYGTVFTENGDLLPYASITVKGTTMGAAANSNGKFLLHLSPGSYTVACQHIGFALQEKNIVVTTGDNPELTFVLTRQKLLMKEIVIRNGEDPSLYIIRHAIKKRPFYNNQVKAFECELYGKDLLKLDQMPDAIFGKKITEEDIKESGLDSNGRGIIYLAESISKLSVQKPGKFKMEVNSSRVSGSNSFGFTFPVFISFYQNNVTVFSEKLNPRGFISPIADNALNFYTYRFLGSFFENGYEVNSILVIPKRKYEPLFLGVINIVENSWRIHSTNLVLTKTAQLEILDSLVINQVHVPVNDSVWVVKNQLLHFRLDQMGVGVSGNFVNVYSKYNVDPAFSKSYFGNTVIRYDSAANKHAAAYWDWYRPVPLEEEELHDFLVRDSLKILKGDSGSLSKHPGKHPLKMKDILWDGINRSGRKHGDQYTWQITGLLKGLEYNPAEGPVVNVAGSYRQRLSHSSRDIIIRPVLRYGFSNTHFDPSVNLSIRDREFVSGKRSNKESWNISLGKRVTQFNNESPITPLVNSLSTLLYGDNLMKTYENTFVLMEYHKRYDNGLTFRINTLYEDRMLLNNVTDFTLFKKNRINITPNYPRDFSGGMMIPHQATIVSGEISFRPGQKYIEYPDRKIPLGSKYPSFTLNYAKGLNDIFGSDVNFDKWKLTVKDDKNFKMAGLLKYKFSLGGFINRKSVFIQDYQHFNGNLSVIASEYLNSFQLSSYYANSTTASLYGIAHIEHHFNGLLTNKIPGLRNWNWNLVMGTNSFYVNQNSNHLEFFAGLENIVKIFRVDFVTAFETGKYVRTDIRIGFGGLLSSAVQKAGGNGVSISF